MSGSKSAPAEAAPAPAPAPAVKLGVGAEKPVGMKMPSKGADLGM